jgi:hypothetical protein
VTRLLSVLWALAVPLLVGAGTGAGTGAAPADDATYVDATVAAWSVGNPVYVSPDSGALADADADALRDRITGWRDDVFVAVLPASAVRQGAGADVDEASALLDELYDGLGRLDGIYVVNFSGAGTYAAGYGDAAGARDVGRIVAGQVGEHTLGQVDQILDGTLDELGAPEDGGVSTVWVLVALLAGVALAASVILGWRRWRRRPVHRPSGETWAGPADYRPSFSTYGDQEDTVEDRAALAREDVTRLGEELDAADPPLTDPAVAAHVQAALDAYADASRRVDTLTTDEQLRQLGQVTDYARWQLGCAQALLSGAQPPARRLPCFVDPQHGLSVADVSWAPPGGTLRPVPVCRACYDRLTNGATDR